MTTYANDTYTEPTNWKPATTHNPELGGPIKNHATVPGSYYIVNNRLLCRGNGVTYYDVAPASADYSVEARIVCLSTAGDAGVAGRISTSTNNFYYLYINASGTQLILAKMVSGTQTTLGTWIQTFNHSTTGSSSYLIRLQMTGTTIKAFLDGVERLSFTDSAHAAAGRGGVRSPAALSDTYTGKHYDNFTIYDSTVAAIPRSSIAGIMF